MEKFVVRSPKWGYGRKLILILVLATPLIAGSIWLRRIWYQAQEESLLKKCRIARKAENWTELQRLGAEWTKLDRHSVDALLFRADAAQHQDDFALAATLLNLVPETDPNAMTSLVSLSALQFGALNRPFDGIQTCERILNLDRRVTAAHQQLIEFYALTLQRRKLEHHIRFAIECSREPPQSYIYLFLMDTMRVAAGVESNSRWLTTNPDSELFIVARVLHMPEPESGVRKPDGDDKFSLVDRLIERFPANLELFAYQVDLCIRRGNIDELISLLVRLPPEADDDSRFWRAKGWLHLNRDELAKAGEALRKAIDLYPLDWNARNWMAEVLRREGKMADADQLHELAMSARDLRARINASGAGQNVPTEILADFAKFAGRCGDGQVAAELGRRLGKKTNL